MPWGLGVVSFFRPAYADPTHTPASSLRPSHAPWRFRVASSSRDDQLEEAEQSKYKDQIANELKALITEWAYGLSFFERALNKHSCSAVSASIAVPGTMTTDWNKGSVSRLALEPRSFCARGWNDHLPVPAVAVPRGSQAGSQGGGGNRG